MPTEPNIRIHIDPTNPGQFFACCGLRGLADCLGGIAEGWFTDQRFCIACGRSVSELLTALVAQPATEATRWTMA